MTLEMWMLFGAGILGLVHLSAASFTFKAQVGNAYSVGARDEDLRPTGVAGRLDRAQRNFLETFAIFASAVLMLQALDRSGSWLSEAGAVIYLVGRTVFMPLYAAGVPWLRTLSWNLATLGLVMVMIAVVWRP
ncbi:MAPEG family protein [Phenylobacterium sp. J426]|uniref:MAPEG family protein n=1 Tax=Phenylobacterium sp. J426 TaxID=2898439 RepID=UPI002151566D|nr:MAPEG family protein [Phenylobacterium sp. J426]MCR5874685.1 MAPEG family protein [Phenylobacterium sp. J426]